MAGARRWDTEERVILRKVLISYIEEKKHIPKARTNNMRKDEPSEQEWVAQEVSKHPRMCNRTAGAILARLRRLLQLTTKELKEPMNQGQGSREVEGFIQGLKAKKLDTLFMNDVEFDSAAEASNAPGTLNPAGLHGIAAQPFLAASPIPPAPIPPADAPASLAALGGVSSGFCNWASQGISLGFSNDHSQIPEEVLLTGHADYIDVLDDLSDDGEWLKHDFSSRSQFQLPDSSLSNGASLYVHRPGIGGSESILKTHHQIGGAHNAAANLQGAPSGLKVSEYSNHMSLGSMPSSSTSAFSQPPASVWDAGYSNNAQQDAQEHPLQLAPEGPEVVNGGQMYDRNGAHAKRQAEDTATHDGLLHGGPSKKVKELLHGLPRSTLPQLGGVQSVGQSSSGQVPTQPHAEAPPQPAVNPRGGQWLRNSHSPAEVLEVDIEQTSLQTAVDAKRFVVVSTMLTSPDPLTYGGYTGRNKETLLHVLMLNDQWDLAEIVAKTQPELLVVKDKDGQTPFLLLVKACLAEHQQPTTIVRWFSYRLQQLLSLPAQSDKSKLAPHAACLKELLLTANWQGISVMHCVAECNNEVASLEVFKQLCRLGSQAADGISQLLTARDRYKGFPAHHAAAANNCAIMQWMLVVAHVEKPDRTLEKMLLTHLNTRRRNVLMCAACGHARNTDFLSSAALEMFEYLLKYAKELGIEDYWTHRCQKSGVNAYLVAASQGQINVMKHLDGTSRAAARLSDCNADEHAHQHRRHGVAGNSALHEAALQGHSEAVEYLLNVDYALLKEQNEAKKIPADCVKHQLATEAQGEKRKRLIMVLELLEPGFTVPVRANKPELVDDVQVLELAKALKETDLS